MSERQEAGEPQVGREARFEFEPQLWHFDVAVAAVGLCSLALSLGLT